MINNTFDSLTVEWPLSVTEETVRVDDIPINRAIEIEFGLPNVTDFCTSTESKLDKFLYGDSSGCS